MPAMWHFCAGFYFSYQHISLEFSGPKQGFPLQTVERISFDNLRGLGFFHNFGLFSFPTG